ncbi:hypothetical protein H0A73_00860 [Alcaligenaceae bacterium]|nr:hypothetical protein [Alcaligenaceae bacterium]
MYTIILQHTPADIPERVKREAEQRFRRVLERVLGGPDGVLATYRGWRTAEDTAESEMAPGDVAAAKRWVAAASRARGDAFRDLGETEAWFEVRLEK